MMQTSEITQQRGLFNEAWRAVAHPPIPLTLQFATLLVLTPKG
jgi:hypothetical protein